MACWSCLGLATTRLGAALRRSHCRHITPHYVTRVLQVLDVDLVTQQIVHASFAPAPLMQFIVRTLSGMCAPSRDDEA